MSVLGPEGESEIFVLSAVCGASGRGGGVDCDVFGFVLDACVASDLGLTVVPGGSGRGGGVDC